MMMNSHPRIIEAVQLSFLNGSSMGGRWVFSKDLTEREMCSHRVRIDGRCPADEAIQRLATSQGSAVCFNCLGGAL